jgi:hypothetical protein
MRYELQFERIRRKLFEKENIALFMFDVIFTANIVHVHFARWRKLTRTRYSQRIQCHNIERCPHSIVQDSYRYSTSRYQWCLWLTMFIENQQFNCCRSHVCHRIEHWLDMHAQQVFLSSIKLFFLEIRGTEYHHRAQLHMYDVRRENKIEHEQCNIFFFKQL